MTGGCGFIGSALVRLLLDEKPGVEIINVDALTYAGRLENTADLDDSDRYRFVRGDVRDAALMRELIEQVEAVLHLAAETHVDRSIDDGRVFFETNTVGTQTLLEAERAARGSGSPKPVVIVSTDEVYGDAHGSGGSGFDEDAALRPSSPYAASKAAADLAALAMRRTFGGDVRIVRGSNTYGPRQFPEKIIPRFVTELLRGRSVPLYGDGSAVRDWLHVEDHARAIVAVLDRGAPGRVYNVAGRNPRTNMELTRAILDLLGLDASRIARVADRPGHDLRYALDDGRIERELGWSPRVGWDAGLARTVDWYRANEWWWGPLVME